VKSDEEVCCSHVDHHRGYVFRRDGDRCGRSCKDHDQAYPGQETAGCVRSQGSPGKSNCQECHHKDEAGKEQKCFNCHEAKKKGDAVAFKEAMHKSCKECCHKK
jgi:hypothetical protein